MQTRDLVSHNDILVLRDGSKLRVFENYEGVLCYTIPNDDEIYELSLYEPDLVLDANHRSDSDVMMVCSPDHDSVLSRCTLRHLKDFHTWIYGGDWIKTWERKPEVLELTMEDLEEKYNCKVKIIK